MQLIFTGHVKIIKLFSVTILNKIKVHPHLSFKGYCLLSIIFFFMVVFSFYLNKISSIKLNQDLIFPSFNLDAKNPYSKKIVSESEISQDMWLFKRKGPSGFSSSSTAEEVTNGIDASGLTAIVTGASSGIGSETARVLALRGVHVVMGVRNMDAGKKVKETIVKEIPSAKIDAMELDLSSLASVRNFASKFTSSGRPLNLLINNAGVMAPPFKLSKDKIELQFATNHLGHFLLANMLLDTMKKTARKMKREGRIVNVSSEAHRLTYKEGIRFDRLNDEEGYAKWAAYGQSKLANVLHANELGRRLKEEGAEITANSLHPGVITTNLFRHMGVFEGNFGVFEGLVGTLGKLVFKNVQQGASTTCYVALHPRLKGVSGEYFSDNNLAKASATATDGDLAKKLWDFSMNLAK